MEIRKVGVVGSTRFLIDRERPSQERLSFDGPVGREQQSTEIIQRLR